jgi:hypothetical protein
MTGRSGRWTGCGFRKMIRGSEEGGVHFSISPRAGRWHETHEPALLAGWLAFEQGMSVPGQFEDPRTDFHAGLLGFFMALGTPRKAVSLRAPLTGHLLEETAANHSIELVETHHSDQQTEPCVLGLRAGDRLLMLAALVRVAGVQGLVHRTQQLVTKAEPAEHEQIFTG